MEPDDEEPPGLLQDDESEDEEDVDELEQGGNEEVVQGDQNVEVDQNVQVDQNVEVVNVEVNQNVEVLNVEQEANVEGSQGTQNFPATQIPPAASLPTMQEAHSTYIPTHKWPPKSVRPEFARALTSLWTRMATSPEDERLWVMESIFWRVILPAGHGPSLGDPMSQTRTIRERLRRWQEGQCGELWAEAVAGEKSKPKRRKKKQGGEPKSQEEKNAARSVILAQEGQYTKALEALVSNGLAECTPETLKEMQSKHPLPARPSLPTPPLMLLHVPLMGQLFPLLLSPSGKDQQQDLQECAQNI